LPEREGSSRRPRMSVLGWPQCRRGEEKWVRPLPISFVRLRRVRRGHARVRIGITPPVDVVWAVVAHDAQRRDGPEFRQIHISRSRGSREGAAARSRESGALRAHIAGSQQDVSRKLQCNRESRSTHEWHAGELDRATRKDGRDVAEGPVCWTRRCAAIRSNRGLSSRRRVARDSRAVVPTKQETTKSGQTTRFQKARNKRVNASAPTGISPKTIFTRGGNSIPSARR